VELISYFVLLELSMYEIKIASCPSVHIESFAAITYFNTSYITAYLGIFLRSRYNLKKTMRLPFSNFSITHFLYAGRSWLL
jgi:hypothetical protein